MMGDKLLLKCSPDKKQRLVTIDNIIMSNTVPGSAFIHCPMLGDKLLR